MVEARQSTDPCTPLSAVRHTPTPGPGYGGAPPGGERSEDPCDLVTVPTRQGLEAVDILRRAAAEAVGPVLHDDSCDTLGFLVPPGTADVWDVPGSTCTQTDGRGIGLTSAACKAYETCEAPGSEASETSESLEVPQDPQAPEVPRASKTPEPPVQGSGWLLPPDESDLATDPVILRAALDEAARIIEAADNCR